jgi:hypothetical protein
MATKTKKKMTAKKPAKPQVPESPQADSVENGLEDLEEEPLMLTEAELAKLDLHDVRKRLQEKTLDDLDKEKTLLSLEYQQKRDVINGKIRSAKASRSEAIQDRNALVGDINKRLGIDLTKCLVNDLGVVTKEEDIT